MKTLRVGFFGCGGIAARHAAAVEALGERMTVAAAATRDVAKARAFAEARGAVAYETVDRMLVEAALDILVVAIPPYAHQGEAVRAARAGVHLLVEKPIALDLAGAARMVDEVSKAGVKAAVGFMYRHGAAVRRWQERDVGRVGLFAASYHCNALHAPWWREEQKSGGQLVEQAIHLVDLVRCFMGEPDSVFARRANLFHRATPGYDVEDVSSTVFGWDDGRMATLVASNIATPGQWRKERTVVGQKLTGRFDDWNKAVFAPTEAGAAPETVAGADDPFVAQLADLADAIRDARAPRATLVDGYRSLRLALAARRSADERREVRLDHDRA